MIIILVKNVSNFFAKMILFNVKVVDVRTQNRLGKPRRHKMMQGQTKNWKKAIVELHEDDRISFF